MLSTSSKQDDLSFLHRIAKEGDSASILQIVRERLCAIEELLRSDATGSTPLHLAVMYNEVSSIVALLRVLGFYAFTAATSLNYDHKLPIHYVTSSAAIYKLPLLAPALRKRSAEEKEKIIELLVPYTFHNSLGKLSDEIKFKVILKRSNPEYKRLEKLIETCCKVANQARKVLLESDTHPEANSYDDVAIFHFKPKLRIIRGYKISDYQQFKTLIEALEKNRVGNCDEFSRYIAYLLYENYRIPSEVMYIKGGDHVFVVINRNPDSNINDYRTWGPDAIVIDAWAGNIYLASEIPARLKNFISIVISGKTMNAITALTPACHQLRRDFRLVHHSDPHQTVPEVIRDPAASSSYPFTPSSPFAPDELALIARIRAEERANTEFKSEFNLLAQACKKTIWNYKNLYGHKGGLFRNEQVNYLENLVEELENNIDIGFTVKFYILFNKINDTNNQAKKDHYDQQSYPLFFTKSRLTRRLENELLGNNIFLHNYRKLNNREMQNKARICERKLKIQAPLRQLKAS